MVRALASHARGRRFEPYCLYHSGDCEKVAKQNEGVLYSFVLLCSMFASPLLYKQDGRLK